MKDDLPGRGRDLCRDLDEFAAGCVAARFAEIGAGERADSAGQVERDHCQDQRGCFRGENTRRQVAQCAVFQVGVDLFDDRVLAMRLVGDNRVRLAGGEERAETVCKEQGLLPVAIESVQFRDPPHDQTPDDVFGFLPRTKRVEGHLSDFGGRYPLPGGLVTDRIGVLTRCSGIVGHGAFDSAGPSRR